jgi:hypothetical protein
MKSLKTKQHSIDLLFPVSLFFVFAVSGIVVLLLAVNIYQGIESRAASTFEAGTSLSYIAEKIHQCDDNGKDAIYIDKFQDCDALVIEQELGDATYKTYIYNDNGSIRELYIEDGATASKSSGTEIMTVKSLTMEQIDTGLFRFSCEAEDGGTASTIVGVNSEEGSE